MKNIRFGHARFAALVLLAVFATAAPAQRPGGGPGGGMGQGGPGRGGPRRGGPGMGRPDRLPPVARLATQPEVASALALSDAQVQALRTIAEASRPPRGGGGGRMGDPNARDAAEAAADAEALAILSDAQRTRLAEIRIQAMGLAAALVPEVQTRLGLSAIQIAALKTLAPARGDRGPGGPPPDGGMDDGPPPDQRGDGRGGPGGPRGGRRDDLDNKISAILTAAQKTALTALGGERIELRRGPGGPPPGGPDGPGPETRGR